MWADPDFFMRANKELTVEVRDLAWWSWTDEDADSGEGGEHRLNQGTHTLVVADHDPRFVKALQDAIAANVGVDLIENDKRVHVRVNTKGEYRVVGEDVCLICNADLSNPTCSECGWDHDTADATEITTDVLGGEAA